MNEGGYCVGGVFVPRYEILPIRRCTGCNRDVAATDCDGLCPGCARAAERWDQLITRQDGIE